MWKSYFTILVLLPCAAHCEENCTKGSKRTMCKYKAKACKNEKFHGGITDQDKEDILTFHNQLRQKVATGNQTNQPQAANMQELIWNDEIEEIAQRWTDQCTSGHDADRTTIDGMHVGQNCAAKSFKGTITEEKRKANFTFAIDMWFSEVSKMKPKNVDPFKHAKGVGHYSQVVWAKSRYVGCGFAVWEDRKWLNWQYVCNYGPGGNVMGASVYKIGSPASNCTSGVKSTNYLGLCN